MDGGFYDDPFWVRSICARTGFSSSADIRRTAHKHGRLDCQMTVDRELVEFCDAEKIRIPVQL